MLPPGCRRLAGTAPAQPSAEVAELVTAAGGCYGGYLRASLRWLWATTRAAAARAASERLTTA